MTSEIVKVKDEEICSFINKERIRSIIEHQKSLYRSSSSSSSSTASSSSKNCRSLLDLMRGGDTSLRRLFDMEHTSLSAHFHDYSCSPITKTIPLWGSETESDMSDPWEQIKRTTTLPSRAYDRVSLFASTGNSLKPEFESPKDIGSRIHRRKLSRKRSFKRLPGFRLWRLGRWGYVLRLKRLRVMLCGRLL